MQLFYLLFMLLCSKTLLVKRENNVTSCREESYLIREVCSAKLHDELLLWNSKQIKVVLCMYDRAVGLT